MPGFVRSSALPFLAVAAVGVVAGPFSTYVIRSEFTVRGQPPYIFVVLITFLISFVLWLMYRGRPVTNISTGLILVTAGLLWITNILIAASHGDPFNHTVWLVPIFLVMLTAKCPGWLDVRSTLVLLAYLVSFALVIAFTAEALNWKNSLYVAEGVTAFEQDRYWLPLDGWFGIEGRWVGPFGHATRTGFAAAFIFVVGVTRWARISIPLVFAGTFFLILAGTRASYLAALAGLAIALLFSKWSVLQKVPAKARWSLLVGLTMIAGVGLSLSGARLTGRDGGIWPAFVDLIPVNPVVGIGTSGIQEAGGLASISGDAHNIFLDQLVRFGAVGLVSLVAFLGVVVVVSFRSASRGLSMPLGILAVYLITSQMDIQNDWLSFSYQSMLVILAALLGALWLSEESSQSKSATNA